MQQLDTNKDFSSVGPTTEVGSYSTDGFLELFC